MRWVFRLLGLIVLIIIAAIAAVFLLPSDRIAGVVEERFQAATGRALTIEGDVRPSLWPALGVNTGAVSIANADWAGDAPMVAADNLSVSVDIGALIGGEVKINGVTLEAPRIALATDAEGRGNWEMTAPATETSGEATTEATAEATGGIPAFSLDQAVITGGQVTFQDAAGTQIALADIDATFTLPDFAGPATLALTASANGAPVSVDATIPAFSTFLASGGAVTLTAGAGDSSVGFDGQAGLAPLGIDGALNADLSDMAGLFAALAMPAPELPEGLGQNTLTVSTALGFDGTTLTLTGTTANLDTNTITGDLAVALDGPRPRLTGTLNAGDLDISSMGGEETEDAAAEDTGPEGWSTEPIDVSALGTIDTDLTVNANSIRTAQSQIGRTALDIDIDNARMVIGIRELVAYDGAIAGDIVVNGRSGLSASADIAGSAIAISRLSSELLDYDRLVALGDMELSVLGSGNSMDALMNSLNGEGSFSFGAGELLGLDLVGMLRNLDTSFISDASRTIFDSITATFRIVDGVVINDNLTILAPLLTATGEGSIGLGGQTLDYRLVPKLLSDEDDGLSVPLLITGTWDAPRFRLDLESLVQGRVDEEIEEIKDEVDEAIRERVTEELGLTADQPSAEEAVRDKVEEELQRGLRNLFD
ncbi:MAG: AsmA family protein [Pseudomonadota bacterium]